MHLKSTTIALLFMLKISIYKLYFFIYGRKILKYSNSGLFLVIWINGQGSTKGFELFYNKINNFFYSFRKKQSIITERKEKNLLI